MQRTRRHEDTRDNVLGESEHAIGFAASTRAARSGMPASISDAASTHEYNFYANAMHVTSIAWPDRSARLTWLRSADVDDENVIEHLSWKNSRSASAACTQRVPLEPHPPRAMCEAMH
jgi:hypothetical protein